MFSVEEFFGPSAKKCLTKEENAELIARYRALKAEGKENAARKLANDIVVGNAGIIVRFAFRYSRPKSDAEKQDVLVAACMGVMRALQDYDAAKGAFSTYAEWKIRDSVQRFPGSTAAVTAPRSTNMRPKMVQADAKFRAIHGRAPTAEELGVSQKQFDRWRSATLFVELDAPGPGDDDDDRPRFQLTYGNDEDNAEYQAKVARVEEVWAAALEEISPRNREIAERVFLKGESLVDVAAAFGLTHPRVKQICERIEVRMKRVLDPASYDPSKDYAEQHRERARLQYARKQEARRASALAMTG